MKNFTKEEWQMIYEIVSEKSNIGMEMKEATQFYNLKNKLENLTKHNNDFKKVCPECRGNGSSKIRFYDNQDAMPCESCNGTGKPILKS